MAKNNPYSRFQPENVIDLSPGHPGGHDGGDGNMSAGNIGERLSKIEGGWTVFQGAVATVSAVMIGAMAILAGVQISIKGDIDRLASKVDTLPGEINSNLLQLNQTLSTAILAAKGPAASSAPVDPQIDQRIKAVEEQVRTNNELLNDTLRELKSMAVLPQQEKNP